MWNICESIITYFNSDNKKETFCYVAEISLSGDDIQFYLVGVSLYAPKIDTEIRAKVASNAMVEG